MLTVVGYRARPASDDKMQQVLDDCPKNGTSALFKAAYSRGLEMPDIAQGLICRLDGTEPFRFYEIRASFEFSVGSYPVYNRWRDKLASLVGIEDIKKFWEKSASSKDVIHHDFGELIWFPDFEGSLGLNVCGRLARAFRKHEQAAEEESEEFLRIYRGFRRVFEFVERDEGWVEFC